MHRTWRSWTATAWRTFLTLQGIFRTKPTPNVKIWKNISRNISQGNWQLLPGCVQIPEHQGVGRGRDRSAQVSTMITRKASKESWRFKKYSEWLLKIFPGIGMRPTISFTVQNKWEGRFLSTVKWGSVGNHQKPIQRPIYFSDRSSSHGLLNKILLIIQMIW